MRARLFLFAVLALFTAISAARAERPQFATHPSGGLPNHHRGGFTSPPGVPPVHHGELPHGHGVVPSPESVPGAVPWPGAPIPRVVSKPYPYGWFGAPPRQHWTRHFGYYRNYTQWSAK